MRVTGFFVLRRARIAACACLITLLTVQGASAQPATNGQRITPNFKDADLVQITEAVAAATGKTIILDPRVRAQVTMFASAPMSPDAFYEAYLSILQVHNFVAMPNGNIVKILPDATARTMPGDDLSERVSGTSDEIVTQVIQVKNVNAAQLVPILRSLVPQNGHLAAYQPSNILIISDRAANVNRIMRIIRRIDQAGDADVEIVPLQNASAADLVRVITTLYQQQQAQEGAASPMKLVADDRSNSVLVSGDPSQRLRIKALIAHLDTPLQSGGDTQVRYLRYADAEKIAPKLKEQITGQAQAAPGGAPGAASNPAAVADRATMIWADPETNALIITAQPKAMRSLNSIIDKLDIRRMQVLVEAIIVEVNEDKSSALGVNWAVWSNEDDTRIPLGGFINPIGGASLVDLATIAMDPDAATANGLNVPSGSTFGIGRIAPTGVNFAAILRAIRSDANTNVIATPSATTMDNQEAELKVAQEVPFLTGSFSSTGTGGTNGAVNPFQTIQREEVGTILKVTPQLNGSDTVILKLEIESSTLAPSSQGAVDLITNKRTINTNVMIEDGGIVVLGGLISDSASKGEQRVPFLGRIPVLGLLFKTRDTRALKNNLMIFIRPKILRDGVEAAFETDAKYRYMQDQQKQFNRREILPLLPGVPKPTLPPPPPPPPAGTGEVDPRVQQEKLRGGQGDGSATQQPAPAPAPQSAPPAQPQGAPAPQATPTTPPGQAPTP
jgi:general secretion pathway protein D